MWSYPVIRERCSCGASTETVLIDQTKAQDFLEKWRNDHACANRKGRQ